MKRTQAVVVQAALAASLSVGVGAAHAVPIVFDFTGTVTGSSTYHYESGGTTIVDSMLGQSVHGRITLETDGLLTETTTDSGGMTIGHYDSLLDDLDFITSELFIGGASYDMGLYPKSGGYIYAFDSNGVAPCVGCSPALDALVIRDNSVQQYWDVPQGEYYRRELGLWWGDPANPLGLVDLSNGFDPLAWLPALNALLPSGSYTERTVDCIDSDFGCFGTMEWRTDFSISSISVSAANVPEPGTLALFAVGLLGTALGRRGLAR